jgi:stearoyl-CoA desaturase (delta-9 desaturase)
LPETGRLAQEREVPWARTLASAQQTLDQRKDYDDPARGSDQVLRMVTDVAQAVSAPTVQGVRALDPGAVRLQRRLTLVVTVVPFIGLAWAAWSLRDGALGLLNLSLFFGFYLFTGLGVTIGLHRLFTHRSFQTSTWMKALLAIAGSMAIQGPVITWVSNHRRHHAFADKEGDPHSPHLDEGPGVAGVLKGLWHAHLGWLFGTDETVPERWAPDLLKDPVVRKVSRQFPLWVVASFAAPAVIAFVFTGETSAAVSAFIWGSLVRIFFLHHVTWSINSICHFYGKRPFETTDHSTNNWVLSLISFGESWHNNHHAFPNSARHGLGRGQIDISASLIMLMHKLGWARAVKVAPGKQIAKKAGVGAEPLLPRRR